MESLRARKDGTTCQKLLSNEFSQVAQGVGKVRLSPKKIHGINTIFFIVKSKIPQGPIVTYANFICDILPLKTEKHLTHLTAGGDRLEYGHDPSSPAVSLLDTKIMINSIISEDKRGAKFCITDIRNFYLYNHMSNRYIEIIIKYFTDEIKVEY